MRVNIRRKAKATILICVKRLRLESFGDLTRDTFPVTGHRALFFEKQFTRS